MSFRSLSGESGGEPRNVFTTIPQRRDIDRYYTQAVEEVGAEISILDLVFQIAMGGAHDPNIYRNRFVAAESFNSSLFECAQQLCLYVRAHVAYLIEEQSAAVCLLELPLSARCGTRKSALFLAKKLR